jgi:uncharacterized protein involved in exopolysaccharide biosynthesis
MTDRTTEREQKDRYKLSMHEREPVSRSLQEYPVAFRPDEEDGQSLSLNAFLEILRRRRVTVISVFLLVLAVAVVLTLLSKPLFSTGARILVEGKTQTVSLRDTQNPLGSLFVPTVGHDIETQVEILRSPMLLDKVHTSLSMNWGAVNVDVRPVKDTDIIDLTVTSTSPKDAERFAKALPQMYLRQVKEERIAELKAALTFAQRRLREPCSSSNSRRAFLTQWLNKRRHLFRPVLHAPIWRRLSRRWPRHEVG